MRTKTVIACTVVLLAAAGLTALNHRPAPAADAPPAAPAGGRYQLIVNQNGSPSYLFDTTTGRVWVPFFGERERVGEWVEHIRPVKPK